MVCSVCTSASLPSTAESARLILHPAERRRKLRVQGANLRCLCECAVQHLALCFDGGRFLEHLIGCGLQHTELVLYVRDSARQAQERLERFVGRLRTPLEHVHLVRRV